MKKLSLILSCLTIYSFQLNQPVYSLEPIIGGSSKTVAESICYLTKSDFLTPTNSSSQISGNLPKTSTNNTLLTFVRLAVTNLLNGKPNCTDPVACTHGSNINLEQGNVLVSPERDVVVNTREGAILVRAKAVVFIMKSELGTVVYDLCQDKPQQVAVSLRKQKLIMGPGVMLVLTNQTAMTFEDLAVNCHTIKYRRPQAIALEENRLNAFAANFSIFSAMLKIEPLRMLVDSKNKKDQSLLSMLLKSAVMLRY